MKSKFAGLDFESIEVLTQEQTKKIRGGYGGNYSSGGFIGYTCDQQPWNCPGYVGPPTAPTPPPNNGEICYQNESTGAFSNDPNLSGATGWFAYGTGKCPTF